MTDIALRPATRADAPAVTAIYGDAVANGTASFEIVPPEEPEMSRRMGVLLDAGYPYFVAERAGATLGFGYAGPHRDRPAYRNTVEDAVYLAEEARGQGIGGALLGRLILESEALEFRQMIAVIGDSENAASIRLHRAAGFEMVGTLRNVGFKHGRWLDTVIMQRVLGSGARTEPTR